MKKVLVIEDNKEILENTAEILELSNYDVVTAENGKIGIERALTDRPDLILCDIMMPELDGYGVLHMVQSHPQLQHTPFIFLTAKTDLSEIRKGMSLGADDYIPKPFDPTDLLTAVEGRLKKASLIRTEIAEGIRGTDQVLTISGGEKKIARLCRWPSCGSLQKKTADFFRRQSSHPVVFRAKRESKTFQNERRG